MSVSAVVVIATSAAPLASRSVAVARRVVLRAHDETTPLLRPLVNRLNNIDKLLLVLQHPVQLIVVSRPEVAHHVFVAEEEHHGHRVVELVHLFEVGDLVEVADVDDGEVLDAVGDFVEDFVLAHAVWVPVAAEADYHQAVFFGHDGLVDVPAGDEVGDYDGAHGCAVGGGCCLAVWRFGEQSWFERLLVRFSRRSSRLSTAGIAEWCFDGVGLEWLAQKVCRNSWMPDVEGEATPTLTLASINATT
jgi:hypothetical protein